MNKGILILIPGSSGKFDSFVFNACRHWANQNNYKVIELLFSKYKENNFLESTFEEQKLEIFNLVTEIIKKDMQSNIIFVSKSLGSIPVMLINFKSKYPKILLSPPIIIGKENENVFFSKFGDLPTEPVILSAKRFTKTISVIIGDKDNKADLPSLIKLKDVRLEIIKNNTHDLNEEDVGKMIVKELEYYARKNK